MAERNLHLVRQVLHRGKYLACHWRPNTTELLITKPRVDLQVQPHTKLGVIAQFGVGVHWQMVGQQIDVVLQQKPKALAHPARYAAIMAAPKKAVVDQNRICMRGYRSLNEGQTSRNARDDFSYLQASFHLQTIGAKVFELGRLQQGV